MPLNSLVPTARKLRDRCFDELKKKGVLRFDGSKFWHGGAYWGAIDEASILNGLMDNYGSLPAARKQTDHNQILKALRIRATKPLRTLTAKGLNFANGSLYRRSGAKGAPSGSRLHLQCSRSRYLSEQAPSPQWDTFLYELWGEDEDYEQKVFALQEALAATLFGVSTSYERAICLYGPKGSGKSRVLKLIEKIVPSDVLSAVNPSEWDDTYLPTELFGKLINVAGELGENAKIEGRRFKEIISGHTITAQRKYGQPFQFQPDCSHLVHLQPLAAHGRL